MATIVNGSTQTIWVRTRSGATITMVLPGARFTFEKNWKKFEVTKTQLTWIERQNRLLEVSYTDPMAVTPSNPTIVFQGIEVTPAELTMVKGDNTTLAIKYLPEGVDISKLKPTVTVDKVKIVSTQLKNQTTVVITAKAKGITNVNVMVGTIVKTAKLTVVETPFFQSQEYKGTVGEAISLDVVNAEKADLTLPENVSVVEGNTIKAEKPGTYEILASASGRTFTTKLVVSDSTETTTE